MSASDKGRDFAVIIHGATGFTGQLVAEYFARNVSREQLPWALSGRNPAKLEQVRRDLTAIDASMADVPLLTASNDDSAALLRLAQSTRVLISTVGPFARHGIPVVDACIRGGADYLDITGEPLFVRQVQADFDQAARDAGVMVVSCCGFDSIPTDLGLYYAVKQLPEPGPMHVDGIMEIRMQMSGGTWNSALGALGDARRTLKAPPRPQVEGRSVRGVQGMPHRRDPYGWLIPLPTIDPEIALRSAAQSPAYGPDFSYSHYAKVGSTPVLAGLAAGAAGTIALAQSSRGRKLLGNLRKSGEGPSRQNLEQGYFKAHFHARTGDRQVQTVMAGGDPGYLETSKMVSECALAFATQRDELPHSGGVLTTVTAMGDVLLRRLQRAGMQFSVVDRRNV